MHARKSQMTIFVILAIVIMAGFLIFTFYYKGMNAPAATSVTDVNDISSLKQYIGECLKNVVAADGVKLAYDGYAYKKTPVQSLTDTNSKLTYNIPVYGDVTAFPAITTVGEEYSQEVADDLSACLSIKEFSDRGFLIANSTPVVNIIFTQSTIQAQLKFPMNVTYKGETSHIEDFSAELACPYSKHYGIIADIMDKQDNNTVYLILGYIAQKSYENDINYTVQYIGGINVFSMNFTDCKIVEGKDFTVQYGIKR